MTAMPRSPIRWRLVVAALALCARGAAAQLPAPPASAQAPIRLGGYGSFVLGHSRLFTAPVADGVSEAAAALLASGSFGGRLSYFAEIEGASRTHENWSGRLDERALQLVRAYGEFTVADALRLRVGRFLTPVGQWNEIHADPLTWTALRPLTTYRPFAKSTTGLMLAGQFPVGGHDVGYAAYVAPPRGGHDREETSFVSAEGGRVAVELLPGLYLGASAAGYRAARPRVPESEEAGSEAGNDYLAHAAVRDDDPYAPYRPAGATADSVGENDFEEDSSPRRLLGADLSWTGGRLELLGEATILSASPGNPAERGAFGQAALRILGPVRAVARYERYDPVVSGPLQILTVGGAVRLPHVTLKLDRQMPDRASARVANGWFVSASAIF